MKINNTGMLTQKCIMIKNKNICWHMQLTEYIYVCQHVFRTWNKLMFFCKTKEILNISL